MSQSRRLVRGISANLMAVATRILVQFATLPIFFASWSVEAVGSWLVLFAVPAYVALVGTGLAGAGGTAALAAAQDGDMCRARRDFQAAWMICTVSTAAIAILFATTAIAVVPAFIDPASGLDSRDVAQAAAWLALYVFATSQMALFDVPFRVAGRYPDHIFLYNAANIAEIAVIALAVWLSDSFATLAMSLALLRCLAALAIHLAARRVSADLFGPVDGSWTDGIAALWKPAVALMLAPLIFGLNLQGYLLLVGAAFGTVILASFAATRTLTRLIDLVTNVTYALQFYESGYLAENRKAIQLRMLATMTLVSLGVSLAFTAAMLVFGAWLQDVYTLGRTAFDAAVAAILLAASSLRALSANPMAVLTADNAHARIVGIYLAASAIALLIAILLATAGAALPIVLLPLLLAEGSQYFPAMRRALALLETDWRSFLRMLVSRQRIDDVQQLARTIGRKA